MIPAPDNAGANAETTIALKLATSQRVIDICNAGSRLDD
jgi:hypothetical protein